MQNSHHIHNLKLGSRDDALSRLANTTLVPHINRILVAPDQQSTHLDMDYIEGINLSKLVDKTQDHLDARRLYSSTSPR